tara:strand:+ start:1553 stop:2629 length:1077 start_codon:yes stop_codon:yes gene_type:complete
MANKDLFKQAIAEAKSVREAAIANAKEALEETLTPHLKDMLAAKLQEMDDKSEDVEEVVNEVEDEVEEAHHKDDKDEAVEEDFTEAEEVEDDAEETEEDEVEIDAEEPADDAEATEESEDLTDLSVDQFKDMIRDIIAQEIGQGGEETVDDMDAGDIEGMGDEAPLEEPADDAEEIDLDELLAELEAISEAPAKEDEMDEAHAKEDEIDEDTSVQVNAESEGKGYNVNRVADLKEAKSDLSKAIATIETLKKELNEVNILNSKLLYVNKIFKSQNLTESQKVNVIAAFDKAETVKEVKLVFETVVDNIGTKKRVQKRTSIKEHRGSASKATGTTASKPEVIAEVSDAVRRMQKLAGII